MNWISENICTVLAEFMGGTIEMFGALVNNIFFVVVEIAVENVYAKNAEKMLMTLALSLAALMTLKVVISGYLMETDYDSEADPFNLIIRLAECVAMITCSTLLFNYLLELAKDFTNDLIGSADANGYATITESLLNVNLIGMPTIANTYIILLLIINISVYVFTIIAGLRGAELMVMKLCFTIFSLDLLTTSRERWSNFFMGYVMTFFTYAIQILLYTIGLKSYATASAGRPLYFLSTIMFILMAIKAPKFLEKYIFKSGMGGAVGNGLRMVAQTAMMRAAYH